MIMKTLPFDILLYIIDFLASGYPEWKKTLGYLSQACKSMVPLCRKHIFSSLHLFAADSNSVRFSNLLSKNPDIARYVTSLIYRVYNIPSTDDLNILDMLKKRSSLRSIYLCSSFDWNELTESIRSSLVSLIQLPTVTSLSIDSIDGFPAMALSGCGSLIDLQFAELNLAPPEANQVISRSKMPAPVSLHIDIATFGLVDLLNPASLHAGGPIVDFSRLQKAEFRVKSRGEIDQVNELIKVTTRLECIKIDGE